MREANKIFGSLYLKSFVAIESLFVQTPPVTVTGERSEQDDPNAVTHQVFSFNRQLKGRESYGRNNERSGEHKSFKVLLKGRLVNGSGRELHSRGTVSRVEKPKRRQRDL